MTNLAIARTCRAIAVLELAGAAWLAVTSAWWIAALVACIAPGLLCVDALARRAHHRKRAEAQRAARLKRGEQVEPLVPCCSFWLHSDGQVHGPGCTRPVLPRRDTYRLDPAARAQFEAITAGFDHGTAA
ncbi:hypothetical protein G9272_32210 [Streptomyces asoensis]|uniref:Uncharacterized protein n=1 Tax=Streptomyces asoensis TaxID=249586 RepID=A0A6M4X8C1_9ACTN|nr:hypothetical protein [Streptomyces asoensis]QJT04383.1 hypothetical protein G9272_32210 [Streptomyces asoensis]